MASNNEYEQQQYWKPKIFISKVEWDFLKNYMQKLEDNYGKYTEINLIDLSVALPEWYPIKEEIDEK